MYLALFRIVPDSPIIKGTSQWYKYLLCAAIIEQARLCYRFIRSELEPREGCRFIDSAARLGITHWETFTRLRVLSSNGKTGMGIVGCPGW